MGSGIERLVSDVLFGLSFIMLGAVGEYLDENPMGAYSCPPYCGVGHKHIMENYGYNSDNRDAGNTSCSCRRSRMGMHVSDKVHNKGCGKGLEGTLRDNCKVDRYKQNSEG